MPDSLFEIRDIIRDILLMPKKPRRHDYVGPDEIGKPTVAAVSFPLDQESHDVRKAELP